MFIYFTLKFVADEANKKRIYTTPHVTDLCKISAYILRHSMRPFFTRPIFEKVYNFDFIPRELMSYWNDASKD
jgi:hypothetical protein